MRDCVNLSAYSDCPPSNLDIDPTTLLPMASDLANMQHNCEVLVARLVLNHHLGKSVSIKVMCHY